MASRVVGHAPVQATRRAILSAGVTAVVGVLTDCSGSEPPVAVPTSPPRSSSASGLSSPSTSFVSTPAQPSATSAPTATGTTATQPSAGPTKVSGTAYGPSELANGRPTRAAVIARYAGQTPSEWGLTTTGVIQRLGTTDKVVALTFDACGGPTPTSGGCGYDRDLIELLRKHRAKATLFLNARWIDANPAVTAELIADPLFEIGNHGLHHLPLSANGRKGYAEQGTHDVGEVYDEVAGNHDKLTRLVGKPPRFFRSGTAHCDEIAVRIVADLGESVVNFSVNGDAGTTFTAAQVVASLRTAKAGDIVISHFNRPPRETAEGYAVGLPALLARGLRTVTLSEYLH